jgi:hypothetical protein
MRLCTCNITLITAFLLSISILPHSSFAADQADASDKSFQDVISDQVSEIRHTDDAVWISTGATFFDYKEPGVGGNLPDSETDWLPSAEIGISGLTKNNIYLGLEGSLIFGDAKYKGAYLSSPTVPITSTTQETIGRVDGQIGKGFILGQGAMLTPYLELGYRYWNRDLGPSEVEKYSSYESLVGLKLQISPTSKTVFTLYGAGGTTIDPQMRIYDQTFNLGDSAVYKAGTKFSYDISHRFSLFSSFDFDHFQFFKSQVVDVGGNGIYEPNSHTDETAVRVGVSYAFDK